MCETLESIIQNPVVELNRPGWLYPANKGPRIPQLRNGVRRREGLKAKPVGGAK